MLGAKLCPNCGNALRIDAPDPVPAGRRLLGALLFWGALAAILAFLWSAGGTGERVGALGAIALLVWLSLRSRRRVAREPARGQRYYCCDQCHQRFEVDGACEPVPR